MIDTNEMLSIDDLHVSVAGRPILRGVSLQIRRALAAEAGHFGNLVDARLAQTLDGTEPLEQRLLACFTNTGELVQQAFGDAAQPELGVVSVRQAMRFIAYSTFDTAMACRATCTR